MYTSGGVPRWNQDFKRCFSHVQHYSWDDVVENTGGDVNVPEWQKAKILNSWLLHNKLVDHDDVVVTDGYWGDGLFPDKTVSVAHGIWSHLTKEDVDAGMTPEFPFEHAVQVNYRRKHLAAGGRIVAVSSFISHQLDVQWGWKVPVINNAIDVKQFHPVFEKLPRKRPVIVHGVTTTNKGYYHIESIKDLDADVLLLDDAAKFFGLPKYEALAQADLVVQPSAYEGNSYFVLEALACGVPLIVYDVGLMYEASREGWSNCMGTILDRKLRSTETTRRATEEALSRIKPTIAWAWEGRDFACLHSIEVFKKEWTEYLGREFGDVVLQS